MERASMFLFLLEDIVSKFIKHLERTEENEWGIFQMEKTQVSMGVSQ